MIKWTPKIQFPTDSNFVNRIIDVTFGRSAGSGNPMITLTTEVVQPEQVEVGTEQVNIAGVQTKSYYVTQIDDEDGSTDEEKTKSCKKRVTELLSSLGLDTQALDWDNMLPQLTPLKGVLILTQMSPDIEEQRKNPSIAQVEAAKKQGVRPVGDVMKHPVTGKALINYWPKIREIFGLAPKQDGMGIPY